MDNAIVVQQESSSYLAPAATLAQFKERYAIFSQFVKSNLAKGRDYLTIPGSPKDSLVKPGAEKLCTLFGLVPKFELTQVVEDWIGKEHGGEPFFKYDYRCSLYRGDKFAGSCDGSCNSWEKKYRYRDSRRKCPACGAEAIIKGKKEYGGGWLCFKKTGGCGANYKDGDPKIEHQTIGLVPNPDIFDQVNTLQKMSQKRAFVGAVLIATNASEYFTQDIEDMASFAEGTFEEVAPGEYKEVAPVRVVEPPAPAANVVHAEAPKSLMTLEMAESELNSKGVKYGDLDSDTLNHMANSLRKVIANNGLTAEDKTEKQYKLDAALTILQARAK